MGGEERNRYWWTDVDGRVRGPDDAVAIIEARKSGEFDTAAKLRDLDGNELHFHEVDWGKELEGRTIYASDLRIVLTIVGVGVFAFIFFFVAAFAPRPYSIAAFGVFVAGSLSAIGLATIAARGRIGAVVFPVLIASSIGFMPMAKQPALLAPLSPLFCGAGEMLQARTERGYDQHGSSATYFWLVCSGAEDERETLLPVVVQVLGLALLFGSGVLVTRVLTFGPQQRLALVVGAVVWPLLVGGGVAALLFAHFTLEERPGPAPALGVLEPPPSAEEAPPSEPPASAQVAPEPRPIDPRAFTPLAGCECRAGGTRAQLAFALGGMRGAEIGFDLAADLGERMVRLELDEQTAIPSPLAPGHRVVHLACTAEHLVLASGDRVSGFSLEDGAHEWSTQLEGTLPGGRESTSVGISCRRARMRGGHLNLRTSAGSVRVRASDGQVR